MDGWMDGWVGWMSWMHGCMFDDDDDKTKTNSFSSSSSSFHLIEGIYGTTVLELYLYCNGAAHRSYYGDVACLVVWN